MNEPVKYQYVEVKREYRELLGERYFRFGYTDDKAVQVCLSAGNESKRGKASATGVFTVGKVTLMENYISMSFVKPISKSKFESKFAQAVEMLK